MDLSQFEGIQLTLKSRLKEGRNRFKLILRDEEAWDGIAWSHSFDIDPSGDSYLKIQIPFSDFR